MLLLRLLLFHLHLLLAERFQIYLSFLSSSLSIERSQPPLYSSGTRFIFKFLFLFYFLVLCSSSCSGPAI